MKWFDVFLIVLLIIIAVLLVILLFQTFRHPVAQSPGFAAQGWRCPPLDPNRPKTWCGNSNQLPANGNYVRIGSNVECLRKGVGVGNCLLPRRPPVAYVPQRVTWCGNGDIPPPYTRRGTRNECLRKGIGIGLRLP